MRKHLTVSGKSTARQQAHRKTKFHFYLNTVFLVLLLFLLSQLPIGGSYTFGGLKIRQPLYKSAVFKLPPPATYPVKVTTLAEPQITAKGVIVIDMDSDRTLYQKNPYLKLFPASTTKLLTALVAVEYYDPKTILTSYRENVLGSGVGLKIGDQLKMGEALRAVLIPSANDAALMLADNYPGGETAFVARMNVKAQALHLDNSQFKNPSGLHDPNHYTSARDLARLGVEALKNPTIKQIVNVKETQIMELTHNQVLKIQNVNQLLGVSGIDGVKTGYTEEAGGCLIATTGKNNHRLLTVVLDSSDRFQDTLNLLSFIWGSYRW